MKIIKRGTPPAKRIWLGTCQSCDSQAEAEESELVNIQHDQRESLSFCWMPCPVCHAGKTISGHSYGGMLFYPKK